MSRNLAIQASEVPLVSFFIPSLKDWKARSARSLVAGWYGIGLTCRIPLDLDFKNCSNSALVKLVLLPVTKVSGRPKVEMSDVAELY